MPVCSIFYGETLHQQDVVECLWIFSAEEDNILSEIPLLL